MVMSATRRDVEKTMEIRKKFVTYQDACELYSMGRSKMMEVAKDAGAVYKIDQTCLINTDILEDYLETFRVLSD